MVNGSGKQATDFAEGVMTTRGKKPEAVTPVARIPEMMLPRAALDLLAPQYGGSRKQAKEALVDLLRDGRLTLYVDYFWEARRLVDAKDARRTRKQQVDALRKCAVDRMIFRRAVDLFAQAAQWDWERSSFVVDLGGHQYGYLIHSRFVADQIRQLVVEDAKKRSTGRPVDHENRDRIWAFVVDYALNANPDAFKTHKVAVGRIVQLWEKRLAAEILDGFPNPSLRPLKGKPVPEGTIAKLVTAVREHLGIDRTYSN